VTATAQVVRCDLLDPGAFHCGLEPPGRWLRSGQAATDATREHQIAVRLPPALDRQFVKMSAEGGSSHFPPHPHAQRPSSRGWDDESVV